MDAQSLQCKVLKIISAVVNITSITLVSNHSEKKKIKEQLGEKTLSSKENSNDNE